MQLVSSIGPPSKVLRERYIQFQSSCLHKSTVTKAFYTKQLIQDREHCSWTSRLQSFVVSLIGEELPVQCEVNNIHDDFIMWSCTTGNSRVCWYFVQKSGSEMTCIVNGDRGRSEVDGKGLVVPCVYIFKGKQKHLERLINLFVKLRG